MIRLRHHLWSFLILLSAGEIAVADTSKADIQLQPAHKHAVWVGQELELNLDLWTTGFSFSGQQFLLPEISGAFLLQTDSSTVKLNEQRDGEAWQGLRYSFLVYPQRAGRLEIPPFPVQFSSGAGYGSDNASFQFTTEALSIEAIMPPGADPGVLLVTTTDFKMKAEWKPKPEEAKPLHLKTGDAISLTVKRSASDVPAMVFFPLPEFDIDGLRAYHDPPSLNDMVNRGKLSGTRTDTVTFICERAGTFDIPEIRFQWWDPVDEVMQEVLSPSLVLEVNTNPAFLSSGETNEGAGVLRMSWQSAISSFAVLILLSFGGWQLTGFLKRQLREQREKTEAGESWAYEQALRNCTSGSSREAYSSISLWLNRCQSFGTARTLTQVANDLNSPLLLAEAKRLQEALLVDGPEVWTGEDLARQLKALRKHIGESAHQSYQLPPLNPVPHS